MPELSFPLLAALTAVAGIAGFFDAIAGGGGLLTLPALLQAGFPPLLALGTNKAQSICGTGVALRRFWQSPLLDKQRARPSFFAGLAGSILGVAAVSALPSRILTPVVMALLLFAAVVVALRRPPQADHSRRTRNLWFTLAVAGAIGAYDGFFGPGTGTFLILAYSTFWGDRYDEASANAKVVNFSSNLAAVTIFGLRGFVFWPVSLAMAVGQVIGGYCGAHVTIRRGQGLVRWLVIAVSLALVLRLFWQLRG